ncbi:MULTISPECIES: anthranilate phosphoribosyltransferase [unclassified Frankia]|uniref:anthranilate phosphoribosyltransferase n=1 Tax=unclassified Frankia TaxID=2632575 RepID=UPI002AD3FF80|nr:MULTISPECIES: anthranilate phosphoribosyltransferase [unclassified Frankia]
MAAQGWPPLLGALLRGEALGAPDTMWAMTQVMSGNASPAQIAGFVVALRAKGETAEEVGGLAQVMLDYAAPLDLPDDIRERAVDTCGTGGDQSHSVNISTMAALVVAGSGIPVIKHGNRAASSACGSADLLLELGVAIDLPPAGVATCLAEAGAAFCFAPVFHPAMRHAGGPRRDLGVPTVFNILGPLTNPGRPASQAVGVADARLAPVVAGVLAARGTRGLVFRGDDGLDELTPTTTSTVWMVVDGAVRMETFDPRDVGIVPGDPTALRGADAAYNAAVTRELLAGGRAGPVRDAVLLAAAAALVAATGPTAAPVTEQLGRQLGRAAWALDSGAAEAALGRWVRTSQTAAAAAV